MGVVRRARVPLESSCRHPTGAAGLQAPLSATSELFVPPSWAGDFWLGAGDSPSASGSPAAPPIRSADRSSLAQRKVTKRPIGRANRDRAAAPQGRGPAPRPESEGTPSSRPAARGALRPDSAFGLALRAASPSVQLRWPSRPPAVHVQHVPVLYVDGPHPCGPREDAAFSGGRSSARRDKGERGAGKTARAATAALLAVIPADAGIHLGLVRQEELDPRVRGDDVECPGGRNERPRTGRQRSLQKAARSPAPGTRVATVQRLCSSSEANPASC
jgi:hypothetical protein